MTFPTSATRDFELDRDERALAHRRGERRQSAPCPRIWRWRSTGSTCSSRTCKGAASFISPMSTHMPSALAHEIANALALSLQPDFGSNTPPGAGALPSQDVIDANIRRITADLVSYGLQHTTYF